MNIAGVMRMSLGEWAAICAAWNKAHGKVSAPPSADEFDAAVAAARATQEG